MLIFYKICLPTAVVMLLIGYPVYLNGVGHEDMENRVGGAMLCIGAAMMVGWMALYAGIRALITLARQRPPAPK